MFLYENRQNFHPEAAEIRIHNVQRHLHCVELEFMFFGKVEHAQMDAGILMPGKSQVAHLSCFPCFGHRLMSAGFGKESVRIFEANVLVELPKVEVVDFQSLEDQAVTIRDRDAMTQERVPVARLVEEIGNRIGWTR